MSTSSCTKSTHWVPVVKTYTGTENQPDNVSLFIKNGNQIKIKDEAIVNSMGHSPCKMITALPRIQKAAKRIIAELRLGASRNNSELWNAIKNLVRGGIQLCPFLGNGVLIVYDYLKTHFYFHPKLKAALADENGPIMGIAFDGKVVTTFSREQINPDNYENPLALLTYAWLSVTLEESKQRGTRTRLELAQQAIAPLFAPNRA